MVLQGICPDRSCIKLAPHWMALAVAICRCSPELSLRSNCTPRYLMLVFHLTSCFSENNPRVLKGSPVRDEQSLGFFWGHFQASAMRPTLCPPIPRSLKFIEEPLLDSSNILRPPLYVKLDLMEQFIKALDKDG